MLLRRAEQDPDILAFWLGGSRGKGQATAHSDYDCGMIVSDAPSDTLMRDLADLRRRGLDLAVMTLGAFERHAAWGSPEAWDRYSYVRLKALVDKTGRAQPLIDTKARVPAAEVASFIHASLDHAINQAYRGLKCLRDGDAAASRLEAAEGVRPFLDATFALHGGRLRPYYKYLDWELRAEPLSKLPVASEALLRRLADTLEPGGAVALSRLLADCRLAFAAAGHSAAFDGWGSQLEWILTWRPS
ncbi:MAG TPA: hypothetical protein VMU37_06015 [Caulobacteraceae bacterium]|nr:hypothetical protein [Caulobacteraceae bacterium]